jgi:2'-5' RNA ligase
MRLFTAILLDEKIRDGLYRAEMDLKEASLRGNFTLRENLHLTLVFIGETDRSGDAAHALDAVSAAPFTLCFQGIGCFSRPGGGLYWAGARKNPELEGIYRMLFNALSERGFQPENRAFKPHLTLGREVTLKDGFDLRTFSESLPVLEMTVKKISLMKSERIGGKLTYTEIHSTALKSGGEA